jgi:hypothetical protein
MEAVLAVPATVEAIIYQRKETSCDNGASMVSQWTFMKEMRKELTQQRCSSFEIHVYPLFAWCKAAPSHQNPPPLEPLWRSTVLV